MSGYADDMVTIMNGSNESLLATTEIFNNFGKISGLILNRTKTSAMWIGQYKNRRDVMCPELQLNWTREVDYLGIKIGTAMQNMASLNYAIKIAKLKRVLNPWLKRDLTPFERIHLIKSVALSQLVYLMTVLEKPTKTQLKDSEGIMFNFIWNNKRDRIKRTTMKNLYSAGGLQVPDPAVQADSLKIVWVKKILTLTTAGSGKRLWKIN